MAARTYVKESRIHGRGLFAERPIRRHHHIGTYTGRHTTRNGRYVLWVPTDAGDYQGIDGRSRLRYLNHSRRPNAVFRGTELFSLRQIHSHEEITIDYGPDWRD